MPIKLILSDLDETFLNNDATVHPDNVAAVQAFVAQGGHFVPNTGRAYTSVVDLLDTLGLRQDNREQYVISYNGGAIARFVGQAEPEIVAYHGLDFDLAHRIFELGLIDETIDAHIYTLDKMYIYNLSESDAAYMAERHVPFIEMHDRDWTFLRDEKPITKVIFESIDPMKRQAIADAVMAELADDVLLTFSSERYVEFNAKGVDKGVTGLELAERLGISQAEVAAFGDNMNDAAQIQAAGIGVAVANARDEIKAMADVVLDKTNNEGAVGDYIRRTVLD
jgi:Cof subfamily protein (haloacid dehalogenase superfamily)